MSVEQQQPPATEASTTETPSAAPRRGWPSPEVWLLGAMGIFGLIGFVLAFGLVMARTTADPQAATQRVQTPGAAQSFVSPQQQAAGQQGVGQAGPPGPQGPPGPAGPRGATGDPGIRIVRLACNTGDCTLQCEPDEVLLTAHCGVGRSQAIYPTEQSALCRSRSTARVEVVAACVRTSRR
ncbi:MAG: hypothetical protein K2Z80_17520 [Xanthobacteraceae bacterium]|nr:hypothetical protein [Xanthobacteraceae bacterium]